MLNPPPVQTVQGVIIYHAKPQLDARIRAVKHLRDEGHDVNGIQITMGISRRSVFSYFKQIDLARIAYIQAFPAEFGADVEALKEAIMNRRDLDRQLRQELALLKNADASCRVAIYKLLIQNLRCLEDLRGFRVARVMHGGEITVKDNIQSLLDSAPDAVRDQYLDALTHLIHTAEEQGSEGAEPG